MNIWGLRESSWANILFTAVQVTGLILVIAAGSTKSDLFKSLLTTTGDGALPAAATVFFVYLGFEKIANRTEEVRNPSRDIPRAIFLSIAVTTMLYVWVSLAVTSLAPPDELARSEAPLALAIESVWPRAGNVLGAIAIFSTANTVLISLIADSRLAYAMGRDNQIPRVFASLLPDRDTPWVAATFIFAMSELLIPIGNVKILAELSSLTALLAFLAVNFALIVLRYRLPEHPRPFRVPFAVARMPIIPVIAIASIGLLMVNLDWEIYLAGGGVILLSGFAYLAQRRWWRRFQ